MRNLWFILAREYLVRVRTRAFVIFTILMPLLVGGLVVLPSMIAMHEPSTRRIAIVAADAKLAGDVRDELAAFHSLDEEENAKPPQSKEAQDPPKPAELKAEEAKFELRLEGPPREELRLRLDEQLRQGKLDGVLWIDADVLATRRATYYARNPGDFLTASLVRRALRLALGERQLAAYGLAPEKARTVLGPVRMESVSVQHGGSQRANGLGSFFLPFVLLFAIYMTVLIYGIHVMRSVIEEKSSRVMEVLLGSVSPMQLMAGKIIGVGAVGLTQIFLWTAAGQLLGNIGRAVPRQSLGGVLQTASLATQTLVLFPVFFLLGYATYACLYAAIGAMVNSDEEASHFQFPVTLPLLVCMLFSAAIIGDPNSPLAFWLSMFPLTSPIVMFVRVSVSPPASWELALSIGISLFSLYGLVWLSSRIYRVGILMYGKRPTLGEVRRWLRYV
jgi:ABC-2 type transport system permease protein